jgi:hypothetical protein
VTVPESFAADVDGRRAHHELLDGSAPGLARGARRALPEPRHRPVLVDGSERVPEVEFRDLAPEDDAGDA